MHRLIETMFWKTTNSFRLWQSQCTITAWAWRLKLMDYLDLCELSRWRSGPPQERRNEICKPKVNFCTRWQIHLHQHIYDAESRTLLLMTCAESKTLLVSVCAIYTGIYMRSSTPPALVRATPETARSKGNMTRWMPQSDPTKGAAEKAQIGGRPPRTAQALPMRSKRLKNRPNEKMSSLAKRCGLNAKGSLKA